MARRGVFHGMLPRLALNAMPCHASPRYAKLRQAKPSRTAEPATVAAPLRSSLRFTKPSASAKLVACFQPSPCSPLRQPLRSFAARGRALAKWRAVRPRVAGRLQRNSTRGPSGRQAREEAALLFTRHHRLCGWVAPSRATAHEHTCRGRRSTPLRQRDGKLRGPGVLDSRPEADPLALSSSTQHDPSVAHSDPLAVGTTSRLPSGLVARAWREGRAGSTHVVQHGRRDLEWT
jgi:hypothetical protein